MDCERDERERMERAGGEKDYTRAECKQITGAMVRPLLLLL